MKEIKINKRVGLSLLALFAILIVILIVNNRSSYFHDIKIILGFYSRTSGAGNDRGMSVHGSAAGAEKAAGVSPDVNDAGQTVNAGDIELKIIAPQNVLPGESVTYTVLVSNPGKKTISHVEVRVHLPVSLRFMTGSMPLYFQTIGHDDWVTYPTVAHMPERVSWLIRDLEADSVDVYTIHARVIPKIPEGTVIGVSVESFIFVTGERDLAGEPPRPKSDIIAETSCSSIVSRNKNDYGLSGVQGKIMPGQELSYTVNFTNKGEKPESGVYVTFIIDDKIDERTIRTGQGVVTDVHGKVKRRIKLSDAFDPDLRLLTVSFGKDDALLPQERAEFDMRCNVRENMGPGDRLVMYAVVHFPYSQNKGTTNSFVAAIPEATTIECEDKKYLGQGDYPYTVYAAVRDASGNRIEGQSIVFTLGRSSAAVVPESYSGGTGDFVIERLENGKHVLNIDYRGDGIYYLPARKYLHIESAKRRMNINYPQVTMDARHRIIVQAEVADLDGDNDAMRAGKVEFCLDYYDMNSRNEIARAIPVNDKVTFEPVALSIGSPEEAKNKCLIVRFSGNDTYDASESPWYGLEKISKK